MAETTLFTYGSFAHGQKHHKKIAPFIESRQSAWTKGSVYRLEVGYPVFHLEPIQRVKGELVQLREIDHILPILDEFQGFNPRNPEKSLFLRMIHQVYLENRDVISTFIYAINPKKLPKTAVLLRDGDWAKDISSMKPLTEGLSECERKYLMKLGKSARREIIPINLELYAKLLKLGLIVDKGRRLALTPLGIETYRFLRD